MSTDINSSVQFSEASVGVSSRDEQSSNTFFRMRVDGEIAILEFDTPNSSANVLSSSAFSELEGIIDDLANRNDLKSVLITSVKKSIFIAGADISEIETITTQEEAAEKAAMGRLILDKLEALPQTTIAVINGACVGGGYELALACNYRVSGFAKSIKIGLPEIKLGLMPGFAGCVRLPKLIGIANALSIILAGKVVDSRKALKMGMIDKRFYDEILLDQAIKFAKGLNAGTEKVRPRKVTRMEKLLENNPIGRSILFKQARKNVLKQTKGQYPAPLKALDTIAAMVGMSAKEAGELESKGFGELCDTDISRSLISVFRLDESFRKKVWTDAEPSIPKVEKCGVIGAGVMGGGIAQLLARKQVVCRVKDLNNEALAIALSTAEKTYKYLLKKRRLKKGQVESEMSLISPTTTYKGFGNCDVAIEAVVEKMNVKKSVFAELDEILPPEACLFTNTSSLSVTETAEATKRPEKVAGFHFFNPVSRMPLLEIITTEHTSDETLATAVNFARKLGKMVIVVKDCPGFIVNRILLPYMNEAAYIYEEGIAIDRLDNLVKKFGMPMGPMELADEVGIDIGYHVAEVLENAYGDRMKVAPMLRQIYDAGILGKKGGAGFYLHQGKKKELAVNPAVSKLRTPKPFNMSDERVMRRLLCIMINEAARCLEEGIVDTAATIDVGMIYGTGFPPFRGGLLKHADSIGAKQIVEDLKAFQKSCDEKRFEPCDLLVKLAETNGKFYESDFGGSQS